MKYRRQNKILELINKYSIETQDELMQKLTDIGYNATQATVSRDVRELKLTKIAVEGNKYKYALTSHDELKSSQKYKNILQETIIRTDCAKNLLVIKTYAGMAQAAAAAIDGINWHDIVGTIAGDDTILIITETDEKALEISGKFKSLISREEILK